MGSTTFSLIQNDRPLLISIPHAGTDVPPELRTRLADSAQQLPDTDWFLDQLYGWAAELGASLLIAKTSRYVVDLNRPPDDQRLYETATTGLIPLVQFDGQPVYREGEEPTDREKQERLQSVYWPYHQAIESELERIRALHGFAVLFDAHSIKSYVPRLFSGKLPDFNLGTHHQLSCDDSLSHGLLSTLSSAEGYSHVYNGRFTGGYITRHYGHLDSPVQAVQLELSQSTYMVESPPCYETPRATAVVESVLRPFVETLLGWRPPQS